MVKCVVDHMCFIRYFVYAHVEEKNRVKYIQSLINPLKYRITTGLSTELKENLSTLLKEYIKFLNELKMEELLNVRTNIRTTT